MSTFSPAQLESMLAKYPTLWDAAYCSVDMTDSAKMRLIFVIGAEKMFLSSQTTPHSPRKFTHLKAVNTALRKFKAPYTIPFRFENADKVKKDTEEEQAQLF